MGCRLEWRLKLFALEGRNLILKCGEEEAKNTKQTDNDVVRSAQQRLWILHEKCRCSLRLERTPT